MPPPMKYAFMPCLDCRPIVGATLHRRATMKVALDQARPWPRFKSK
jgi:hypothetical protein